MMIGRQGSHSYVEMIPPTCHIWATSLPPAATGMEEYKNIPYVKGSTYGTWHEFDLYVPSGQANPGPLIVFVHGGAWRS